MAHLCLVTVVLDGERHQRGRTSVGIRFHAPHDVLHYVGRAHAVRANVVNAKRRRSGTLILTHCNPSLEARPQRFVRGHRDAECRRRAPEQRDSANGERVGGGAQPEGQNTHGCAHAGGWWLGGWFPFGRVRASSAVVGGKATQRTAADAARTHCKRDNMRHHGARENETKLTSKWTRLDRAAREVRTTRSA